MFKRLAGFAVGMAFSAQAGAAGVTIFDDALQSGFQDWSFPVAFTTTANPVHSGAASIVFTGNATASNGLSFTNPGAAYAAANYTLRFFLDGGVAGGQHLALMLQTSNGSTPILDNAFTIATSAPLNGWVEVDVPLGGLPFNANGSSFDRIDLLPTTASEPTLYVDDITLVASGGAPSTNYIFGDSVEPEYMFVPQYANNSVRVYQRTINTTDFFFVNEASLGASVQPNAVAIAPDGAVWVLDTGATKRLLRYSVQALVTSLNPAADVTVGALGANAGDVFDVAFFGAYAYVSQSDFGATNRILKFALSDLNAGNNVSTNLTNAGLSVPVGLAFDAQGRLWICNYGTPGTLVRMNNVSTGAVDVTISGNSIDDCEGLAFDEYGSLWVGDNNEPTMYGYGSSQIVATGSPTPIGQINMPDPAINPGHTGFVGGIAIDRHGDLRANYENDNAIEGFTATAAPWNGPYTSYTSTTLTALNNATTDPGRGGIAIWPVPHTVPR